MKVTNVARRVWTTALVKVVLRCKIVVDTFLARASIARRPFRGLSDWLACTLTEYTRAPTADRTYFVGH